MDHTKSKGIPEKPLECFASDSLISCFIDYTKAFEIVGHNKLWKNLNRMRIPNQLTCLLRNLYASREATVRTGQGKMACFKIEKGVYQDCILSCCLLNSYAEYIMQNVVLDKSQARIKIAGRDINNHSYANDTTLMAKSEEKLKSLLKRVKGE